MCKRRRLLHISRRAECVREFVCVHTHTHMLRPKKSRGYRRAPQGRCGLVRACMRCARLECEIKRKEFGACEYFSTVYVHTHTCMQLQLSRLCGRAVKCVPSSHTRTAHTYSLFLEQCLLFRSINCDVIRGCARARARLRACVRACQVLPRAANVYATMRAMF